MSSITPLGIYGAISQSADLTIWKNAIDNTLARVDSTGKAIFNCYEFPDGTEQCTAFTKECITINDRSILTRSYDFIFLEVNSTFDVFLDSAENVDCGTTMIIKRKKIANQPLNDYVVNIKPKIDSNQTIDGEPSFTIHYTNQSITLVSDGSNWHIV